MAIFVEAMLVERGGPEVGVKFALSEGMTVIGRADQCDVVMDDPGVSRQHAGIRGDANRYKISDLGSRNGTFVNGDQVGSEPRLLRNFDRIEFGGTTTPIHWVFLESQATVGLPAP